MKKQWMVALVAAAGGLSAGTAHAGNVFWSIGIQAPPVTSVISNGPVYQPYYQAPQVYYQPAPVYYQPPPVYYQPAPVYYQPQPVYIAPPVVYRPAPVVVYSPPVSYAPQVVYGGWGGGHHHGNWGRRDEYGSPHQNGWARDERRWHH